MSVPPDMMGAGPMIPPPPMGGAPMMPPMPSGGLTSPAEAALPGMAQLAQAQSLQLAEHQRQMAQMQEEMNKQIMMLIASLPTPNPAGNAAASTPSAPMMSSPSDQSSMGGSSSPSMPY